MAYKIIANVQGYAIQLIFEQNCFPWRKKETSALTVVKSLTRPNSL